MIAIDDRATIGAAFRRAVDAYGPNSFLAVPPGSTRSYHRQGLEIDYALAGREVECLIGAYRAKGVGHGHRVAMLLENGPSISCTSSP